MNALFVEKSIKDKTKNSCKAFTFEELSVPCKQKCTYFGVMKAGYFN